MTRILTATAVSAAIVAIVLWAADFTLWRANSLTDGQAEQLYLWGLTASIAGCGPALLVLLRVLTKGSAR